MLIAALAVTLVGFILLVVALVISSVAFAWGCIGVCILGIVLLIVDVVRGRRGSDGGSAEKDEDDASAYGEGGEPGDEGAVWRGASSDRADDAEQ